MLESVEADQTFCGDTSQIEEKDQVLSSSDYIS